jgi:Flp pilus assembly protein TadD
VAGDLDAAARDAEALLALDRDDVRGLDVLAVVSARRGDSEKAVAFLRRALSVNPFDAEAKRILATWEAPRERARD